MPKSRTPNSLLHLYLVSCPWKHLHFEILLETQVNSTAPKFYLLKHEGLVLLFGAVVCMGSLEMFLFLFDCKLDLCELDTEPARL